MKNSWLKSVLPLRVLLGVVGALALAMLLALVFYFTDLAFSVWDRIKDASPAFFVVYIIIIILLAAGGAWLVWNLSTFWRGGKATSILKKPVSEQELIEEINRRESAGVPVSALRQELQELQRRREAGEVVVALFGEISAGKSSMINALLPGSEVATSPLGGTTRAVERHIWESPAGDRLVLVDLPGLNEADGTLDEAARAEAMRAHIVIYVCEGDLTRDQYQAVRSLLGLGKPLLLALNKVDRFLPEEIPLLRKRLSEHLGEDIPVVAVQSGGTESGVKRYADGREEPFTRKRPPDVEKLKQNIQTLIDSDPAALEQLRDAAVFALAHDKLDVALGEHRAERAKAVVQSYSRKAVFGGLAAVGPGTDVLVQGYLGISMLKALCALYEVPAKEIDLQKFIDLAGTHVKKQMSILLALAGNVLKAFPGVGTVLGGMLHAVAYGLIFEALGKAAARSLEQRGTLEADTTLRWFEEELGENLESRARSLAGLVVTRQLRKH